MPLAPPSHLISVAPMLDWTDRHERYFLRLITQKALLYTEMVTTGAILNGDKNRLLDFSNEEHPIALQLGGSNPEELAQAASVGQSWGYDEINLNVGCPSDRVQSGLFGACLMKDPKLVATGIKSMQAEVSIPVTVKCRIGVDEYDSEEALIHFIETVHNAGCNTFIIHARKAWLQGLSPKENREIPPLNYPLVYKVKTLFPELTIVINGGIQSLEQTEAHLQQVDGVMLGRVAYQNPWLLQNIDATFFASDNPSSSRREVVEKLIPYAKEHIAQQGRLQHIARHILGLYQDIPGAKVFRRHLSQNAHKHGVTEELLLDAVNLAEAEANSALIRQQDYLASSKAR